MPRQWAVRWTSNQRSSRTLPLKTSSCTRSSKISAPPPGRLPRPASRSAVSVELFAHGIGEPADAVDVAGGVQKHGVVEAEGLLRLQLLGDASERGVVVHLIAV